MMSIVYNFSNSDLHQKIEALTLKAGYLLSTEVCTAGSTCHDMWAKENLSNLSMFKELDMLEHMHQNAPEFVQHVIDMRNLMKQSEKIKHKTGRQLIADREGKKLIHKTWLSSLNYFQEIMNEYGFKQLKEFTKEDMFKYYPINNNPEDASDNRLRVSDLLQRFLVIDDEDEEDAEPEIFFLGTEFLGENYEKPYLYHATDKEARNSNNIVLHHCFTLPNINKLTADELRLAHNYIKEEGSLFWQHTNKWIDMCYSDNDITQRLSFFKNKVTGTAKDLQRKIRKRKVFNIHNSTSNDLTIEVWMGEIPVWQLWNYYKHHNAIQENTWNKLMMLKEEETYNKRWPVMMLYVPNKQLQKFLDESQSDLPEEEGLAEEIKATKKYILID